MRKRFDEDLHKLKQDVLDMGSVAEGMIRKAMGVLVARRPDLIGEIMADEDKLDAYQRSIDNETGRLFAIFGPVAHDLRFLLMITRINAEIERIGDHVVNICRDYQALQLLEAPPIKPLVDLPRMAGIVEQMLHRALEALRKDSEDDAEVVIQTDDQVDRLNDQIFCELLAYMLGDPRNIRQSLGLILTGRSFERIADRAVNVAEDVIYILRGEDIRHVKDRQSPARSCPADRFGAELVGLAAHMKHADNNALIVVVVERGTADAIVEAARGVGASGATVFFARGMGTEEQQRLFRINVDPMKEVVMILAQQASVHLIVSAVTAAGRLTAPGAGILFTVPVGLMVGLEYRKKNEVQA